MSESNNPQVDRLLTYPVTMECIGQWIDMLSDAIDNEPVDEEYQGRHRDPRDL